MNRSHLLLFTLASVFLVVRPAGAQTCDTLPVLTPHVVDASMQAIDHSPPNLPSLPTAHFRSVPKRDNGCLPDTSSKCDFTVLLDIAVNATDDMTPADKIGYRLSLESGTLPSTFVLPADAVERAGHGPLTIVWVNSRRERGGSFGLKVVAIDAAGNESAPQTVLATDVDVSCETVAGPGAGPALVVLLLAAWRRLRRKPKITATGAAS